MNKRNPTIRGEAGSAYIVVLLVLLLLTIFGLSLVLITHTERQIGANERDAGREFFAAESGVAVAIAWLQESNTQAHEVEVGRRVLGSGGNTVDIRDRVQTSQLVVVGSQDSNLGDVSSNNGQPQDRANFRFESTARRVSTSTSGPLAGRDVQLGQKRVELMVEMDPFDLRAENAYTGPLEYESEEAPTTLAPAN
ncbi:MAG: hypothetical protein KDD47_16260 [Acidobacteria bacterium]|nr:hypothetical protein [Acidobacteriota bacterium]